MQTNATGKFLRIGSGVLVAGVGLGAALTWTGDSAAECPPGYVLYEESEREGRDTGVCVTAKHPEPPYELLIRQAQLGAVRSAPFASVAPGAFGAAVADRSHPTKWPRLDGTGGRWESYGSGPLVSNGPQYGSVNGLGLVNLMGRIDHLSYDQVSRRLFAAKGTGGIWVSDDLGDSWRSIGDKLPSQIVGAVAWTSAGSSEGTVVAISGDPTFGGGGYTGYGAFYSTNMGGSWKRASGVPDGALGFAIEVDPTNPLIVYAGTSVGLFRSTNGGKAYANVFLPTGGCAGVEGGTAGRPECQLANVVTDVIVRAPGGLDEDVPPGTVLAAVGWRAGARANADGTVQSPGNGIYRSWNGAPGTFVKLPASGFAPQERIGRVEFGPTSGPLQDHDYVYAIVQDAVVLNGGLDVIDAPEGLRDPRGGGTNLNGIYVSADFGATWTRMADDNAIAKNPATGSALVGAGQATGFEPGVQAWYNEWILPDPTRQTAEGIPTRLAFGLEEVWQNELPLPMNGPATFKVIGRYFSDNACLLLTLGLPECPTNRPPTTSTTTHPDQHAAVWVPDGLGGVTLAVGNDGGFYKNHVGPNQELDNGGWGNGHQAGFNTLLPYDVAMAKDGTAWAGLQDNGHLKITPAREQFMTFGGDGTFAEVDPDNSNVAYEATPFLSPDAGGDMRVSVDGGRSWTGIGPSLTNTRFINPFEMDPTDAKHLVTAGNEVVETVHGPETGSSTAKEWALVYDLGTPSRPGDAGAAPSATDPANGMSAIAVRGSAVYVGFCGPCDILNATAPFTRGIATNIGGTLPPKRMTSDGWHIARAQGLPSRYVTSIAIDPLNPRTVYVTLGGYSRRWVPPGTLQDQNPDIGEGHLFVSTDAGETFVDISGNLPDVPATWVTLRERQLLIGTDVGVFASALQGGAVYTPLRGLPVVPISTMQLKPGDPNLLVVATYGRGVWTFQFSKRLPGGGGGGPDLEMPPAPLGSLLAGPFGFELDAEGWRVETNSTNPLMTWDRGAPGDASASSFNVAPYFDESVTSLVSPAIAHPGGWTFVEWSGRRDLEPGFDYMYLEYSSDGQSWSLVPWFWDAGSSSWRNDKSFDGKNTGHPGFAREIGAFKAAVGTVYVRFRLVSDQLFSSPAHEGVYVDNVVLRR